MRQKIWFLVGAYPGKHGKDIQDPKIFPDGMPIEDLYESKLLDDVVRDRNFMCDWRKHEFYKKDGKVAKWQNY